MLLWMAKPSPLVHPRDVPEGRYSIERCVLWKVIDFCHFTGFLNVKMGYIFKMFAWWGRHLSADFEITQRPDSAVESQSPDPCLGYLHL